MTQQHRGRAWLPAAVASVSVTLLLVLLQLTATSAPGFFGPGGLDPARGRVLLGTVVALAVLLGVGLLGCRLAIRAAGASAPPVFLSVWMVLVVVTTLASFGAGLVRDTAGSLGEVADAALGDAGLFGVRWGWVAALLAVLVHLAVGRKQSKVGAASDVDDALSGRGEAGVIPAGGYVLKRVSDFPDITLGPTSQVVAAATLAPVVVPVVVQDRDTAPDPAAGQDAAPAWGQSDFDAPAELDAEPPANPV